MAFNETAIKYIIYFIPFVIPAIYTVISRGRLLLYRPELFALMLYLGFALGSLLYNGDTGFYTLRDLMIIGGYLFLFTIYIHPPPFVADMAMGTFAVGLVVDGVRNGANLSIDFLSSNGIIESVLAFPLGVVFLYYFHERKWVRMLIALLLLLVAFKRIALLAAGFAIALDIAFRLIGSRGINKAAAIVIVVGFSLTALYLDQIYVYLAEVIDTRGLSANAISLGRWQLAIVLWDHIQSQNFTNIIIGFGPAAAEKIIELSGSLLTHPHNDWLKLLFDYGIVGFIGAHVIFFIIHARNSFGTMVYVYTAILMMTDNVLIYIFYFVFVFLLLRIDLQERFPLLRYSARPSIPGTTSLSMSRPVKLPR